MYDSSATPVVVGISGASGSVMARGVIERLLEMGRPVIATASPAARMVWRDEMDESFGDALERWG
ncbi:MAG: aromatic acid decarboxylase, partial [SAR202 cluster bacterium]|nr:aromatic acid decarboxylase [SAR202 cluster bacterium]